jgi:ParB family chromosome partitioning protein
MNSDSSGQTPQRTRGLGSGLAALLGETGRGEGVSKDSTPAASRVLSIGSLRPGRLQPRTEFDSKEIQSLAASISTQGIIQPILVRPAKDTDGDYEIIAGERRWRAAQLAGLHEVPVVVHFIGDQDALEIALIENLQRQNLNVFEEAEAYQHLIADYGNSQEEVAQAVGRSRSHVANVIRLLALAPEIKQMTVAGKLSPGHARVLLGAENAIQMANKIVSENLNVRQTEKLISKADDKNQTVKAKKEKNADLRDLEDTLTNRLGLRVRINEKKRGGNISVEYKTLEQLDEFLKRLN